MQRDRPVEPIQCRAGLAGLQGDDPEHVQAVGVIRRGGQELTIDLLGLGKVTCRKQLLTVPKVRLDLVLALAHLRLLVGRALAGSRGRPRAERSPAWGRERDGANRLGALRLMGKIVSPDR
jgi:hypothetical protein